MVITKHWFKFLIGIVGLLLIATLIYTKTGAPKLDRLGQAPDFILTDLQHQEITLQNTNDRVRLVYFYFSNCPDVCPPTTYVLSKVQQGLKDAGIFNEQASIFSITFDPIRDTKERLTEFSQMFNADPNGWYFLSGDEQYTHEVAKQYKVLVVKDENGQFGHSNLITLLDKEGEIRKRYRVGAEQLDNEDLAQTIVKDMANLARES